MIVGLCYVVECTAAVARAYGGCGTRCVTAVVRVVWRSSHSKPCCLKS